MSIAPQIDKREARLVAMYSQTPPVGRNALRRSSQRLRLGSMLELPIPRPAAVR